MSALLRINHFIQAANHAYTCSTKQYIQVDPKGIGVESLDLPSSFSPEAKENNRRSWRELRTTLYETLGKRKFDWICDRYRHWFDFAREEKEGKPLLDRHLEIFSIGAWQTVTKDIKEKNLNTKIKNLSRQELHERICELRLFPLMGDYKDPIQILGTPSSFKAFFFHNTLLMDKEKQLLFSDVKYLSYAAWVERFAKVVCNRELMEGQLIEAPGRDGKPDYYKVYRKITSGDGLIAYALKPATHDSCLPPTLFFRPSQWSFSNEDADKTYLNDLQIDIGKIGWKGSKHLIDELIHHSNFRRDNEKVTLVGYSLGGVHAQYVLAHYTDYINHAILYNNPSVMSKTAEKFAQRMNAAPRLPEPLNIQIFRMKYDFCADVGEKHVGWGVNHPDVNIQLVLNNHDTDRVAFTLHSHRIFDNRTFPYNMECIEGGERLFNQLDNSSRGLDVSWYETTRKFWGPILFYVVKGIASILWVFSKVFGVKILRSSIAED